MIRTICGVLLSLTLLGPGLATELEVLLTTIDTDQARLAQNSLVLDEKKGSEGVLITIDRSQKFQSMLGCGAALTHSSAALLMKLRAENEAEYAAVLEQFFRFKRARDFESYDLRWELQITSRRITTGPSTPMTPV